MATPMRTFTEAMMYQMVSVDEVRAFALTLPRAYEVLVRDRVKFRVGRIVFVAFSRDETLMGFGFPKEERDAMIAAEPEKFVLPEPSDLRYQWLVVRLAAIDVGRDARARPRRVADVRAEEGQRARAMTSAAWRTWREGVDLDDYDARWDRMAAAGEAVHGEADLVASLGPASVLDAGCGTGRVGIELARRGIEVVGVDADPDMLARARRRSADVTWVLADLAALDLGRTFDVVVLAGNVLPFVEPADRAAAVAGCARHLGAGGRLVAGAGLRAGLAERR